MSMLLRRAMMMASSLVKHIVSSVTGLVSFVTNVAADMPSVLCEFAPIQSGSGDPSPYNVRPISGWTGLTVTRAGKNLLAKPFVYRPVPCQFSDCFFIKKGTYTFSFASIGTATKWRTGVSVFDANGNALSDAAHKPHPGLAWNNGLQMWYGGADSTSKAVQYTFVEDCFTRIWFGSGETTSSMASVDAQLELGSTATPYTAYVQSSDVSVNWQSDAGTVYGGTLDVATGVLTATHITKQLSDYSWTYQSQYSRFISSLESDRPYGVVRKTSFLCSYYFVVDDGRAMSGVPNFAIYSGSDKNWYIHDNRYTTEASLMADVGSQEICYELATPVTYQLTPQQIASIIGTNNVWHNANGGITVEYYDNH